MKQQTRKLLKKLRREALLNDPEKAELLVDALEADNENARLRAEAASRCA